MNYRLKHLLMANVIVLSAFNGLAQAGSSGFTLEGTLEGLQDGTVLYLRTANLIGKRDTIASDKTKGNSFKLTGKLLPEQLGREFLLSIDFKDERYKKVYTGKDIFIYPDNSNIKVNGRLGKVIISGSQIHDDFLAYNEFLDKKLNVYLNEFVKPLYREFEKKVKADTAANAKPILEGANAFMSYMSHKKNDYSLEWMKTYGASLFAPSLTSLTFLNNLSQNEELYALFSEKAQHSYYGIQLKTQIDAQKKVAIGSIFPFVTLKNVEGKQLSLKQVAAANELTIVDFWAYWCGPCRANFPHLKDVYNRYKDKGVTVYAVSIDTTYKPWIEAVKQEKLTWNNVVLDTIGQGAELFGITAVPTSFLIDKKGKIIAHWVGDMSTLEPTIKQYLKM